MIISPSMLSCDLCDLRAEALRMLDAGADALHMDVMDGVFVPNLTFGFPVLKSLKRAVPEAKLDCHLMMTGVHGEGNRGAGLKDYLPRLYGVAHSVSFHVEVLHQHASPRAYFRELAEMCSDNRIEVGLALRMDTPVEVLEEYAGSHLGYVLLMTVEPGFSGQKFNPLMLEKIKTVRRKFPKLPIQVDGGVNSHTIRACVEAGATRFVSGSTLFNAKDPASLIRSWREK